MNNKMGPVRFPEKNAEMLYKWESCPGEKCWMWPSSKAAYSVSAPPGGATQVFRMKSDDILATPIDLL
jgi:hypothetical protein